MPPDMSLAIKALETLTMLNQILVMALMVICLVLTVSLAGVLIVMIRQLKPGKDDPLSQISSLMALEGMRQGAMPSPNIRPPGE